MKYEHLGYPRSRRVVIPNGFNTCRFQRDEDARRSVREELELHEGAKLIGRFARDDPMKGLDTLLLAFGQVARHDPSVHIVLVGSKMTPARSTIMRLALVIPRQARLLLRRNDDIAPNQQSLDGDFSSRRFRRHHSVIGEAMACGVPVVVTDVGESKVVVGDPSWVVQPDDPAALAAAIQCMVALTPDQRQELGVRNRRRIIANYNINAVALQYASVWESAIQTAG